MFAVIKRLSRFQDQVDASMEKFIFHHKFFGFFLVFVGMPLITLVAVCLCTTIIAMPIALVLGGM